MVDSYGKLVGKYIVNIPVPWILWVKNHLDQGPPANVLNGKETSYNLHLSGKT